MKTDNKDLRREHADAHAEAAARAAGERVLEGLGVSPGVAIGQAYLRDLGDIQVSEQTIGEGDVAAEIGRFEAAVGRSRRQVAKLKDKAKKLHGAAAEELGYLLDAHMHMLRSESLIGGIARHIETAHCNAEHAVVAQTSALAQSFTTMDDPYLKSRGQEVREVGYRIIRNLTKAPFAGFDHLDPNSIIIAEEITPADTALMDPKTVAGFGCALGGAEGHTAIMARSLGLPAVLGVAHLIEAVNTGDTVVIDGFNGLVIVNPTPACRAEYEHRRKEQERQTRALRRLRDVAAVTRDEAHVTLQANLELPRDVEQALAAGAEGVGLLRTEFLYMNREDLPGEEEQYQVLKEIVTGMEGRPVTVRTLDIGGEKLTSSLGEHVGEDANPALGLRAIRLSLKEPRLLEVQLAAMLRAGAHGPLRILLPMISNVSEVHEVRKILARVVARLRRRRAQIADPLPPVGVMIEVPGAALAADAFAHVADFFAIGTNDLTMYTLAIDRGQERVAHLYNPLHPGVLRLIQFSVQAALRARIPVSVCGEIAGDPRFTPLILGLGVRELSMAATALPRVKSRVLNLDMRAATQRAHMIMDQFDSGRISALLDDFNDGG